MTSTSALRDPAATSSEPTLAKIVGLLPLLAVALLMFVGVAAVTVATTSGVGATPDSTVYVSVADNLSSGRGLTMYDGSELTLFPPGFPAVLAVGSVIDLDARGFGRVLNAATFALVILMSYLLLRRHLTESWLVVVGTTLVAVSAMLILLHSNVLAEIPFVAVTLAFVLLVERAYADQEQIWWVVAAGALAGAACLFRYAGPALIAFGIVVLTWQAWQTRRPPRLLAVLVFVAVSAWVPMVWIAHNLAHGPRLFGERLPPTRGVFAHAGLALETLAPWYIPEGALAVVGVAVLAAAAAGFVLARRDEGASSPGLGLLTGFFVFFLAFTVVAASLSRVDVIGNRLLSPVYVPALVIVLAGFELFYHWLNEQRRFAAWVLVTLLAAWSLHAASLTPTVVDFAAGGTGFAGQQWLSSPLLATVDDAWQAEALFSNVPGGVYHALDRQPVFNAPMREDGALDEFVTTVRCEEPVLFAQFEGHNRPTYAPDEFVDALRAVVVAVEEDGTLYRVSAIEPPLEGDCPH